MRIMKNDPNIVSGLSIGSLKYIGTKKSKLNIVRNITRIDNGILCISQNNILPKCSRVFSYFVLGVLASPKIKNVGFGGW